MDISKRVFGSNVSEKIRNYINKLQEGTFDIQPGEEISANFDTQTYLGEKTPYVRMWVSVSQTKVKWSDDPEDNTKKKWNPVGERENFVFSINENRRDAYEELESIDFGVDYAHQSDSQKNPLLKPPAGIKSINSKSEGSLGALRRTTVEFVVHNKNDFDQIYLPFFLKPGANVFIDFGWSDKVLSLYNPETILRNYNDVYMRKFWEDIIQKREDSIEGGFQTTIAGNVVKYDVSIDKQGSFNCTLELVSGNYRLLDKSVSDDNSLRFVFKNSMEELLLGYYARISGINVTVSDFEDKNPKKEKKTEEERTKKVREIFDTGQILNEKQGLISPVGKLTGIFFQQEKNTKNKLTDKESLYISYGLLEDKFLNNFISLWHETDESGTETKTKIYKADKSFTPSFTSIHSYVRWDINLFKMMKEDYRKEDEIISFLYPDNWETIYDSEGNITDSVTYNKVKPNGWGSEADKEGNIKSGTQIDKEKRRIPLRELFISVPLISEAFAQSENVNDALEFIFEAIKRDSGDIVNIKMISPNDAQSAITFTDVNVELDRYASEKEEILEFDLTSGNTIVQNFDLKLETPKAGLSSMIAIGNLSQPKVFDELELMKFNLLNNLTSKDGGSYQVQHLPIFEDIDDKDGVLAYQLEQLLEGSDDNVNIGDLQQKDYNAYKKSMGNKDAIKYKTETQIDYSTGASYTTTVQTTGDEGYEKFDETDPVQTGAATYQSLYGWTIGGQDDTRKQEVKVKVKEEKNPDKNPETGTPIVYAESKRDYYLLLAKLENFVKSNPNSISPVMPITLSLKVYGNNFLNVGDFFTVNYLPKHYQERVIFQIVGVDHTLDTTGWATNYTTVMRLKPTDKSTKIAGIENQLIEVRFHSAFQKVLADDLSKTLPSNIKNDHIKNMVTKIEPGEESEFVLDDRIRSTGVSHTEIPDINFKEEVVTLNPKEGEEEYKEDLQKLGTNKNLSKTKIPMGVNITNINEYSRLKYWHDISDLILGDDLIDWEKVKNDYESTDNKLRLAIQQNLTSLGLIKSGAVFVTPRLDGTAKKSNRDVTAWKTINANYYNWSDAWKENVLESLDDINNFGILTEGFFDIAQREIDFRMFANSKNKVSKHLDWYNDKNKNKYNFKRDDGGNPYLFHSIFWDLPQEQESEWSTITITLSQGNENQILPLITIPKKYRAKSTFADVVVKFTKRYSAVKGSTKRAEMFTKEYYKRYK